MQRNNKVLSALDNEIIKLNLFNNPENEPWKSFAREKQILICKLVHQIYPNESPDFFDLSHFDLMRDRIIASLKYLAEINLPLDEVFTDFIGLGKLAADIICLYGYLHKANLLSLENKTKILTICDDKNDNSFYLSRGSHELLSFGILKQNVIDILFSNPQHAISLASGLVILHKHHLFTPQLQGVLAKNPKEAQSIALGLSYLQDEKINPLEYCEDLTKSKYAFGLAQCLCELNKVKMLNQTTRGELVNLKIIEFAIPYLLSDLRENRILNEKTFSQIINLNKNPEQVRSMGTWFIKLDEQKLISKENVEQIFKYSEILATDKINDAIEKYLLIQKTRHPDYLYQVVKLTQDIFDKVIAICQEENGNNIEKIVTYFKDIATKQNSTSNLKFFDEKSMPSGTVTSKSSSATTPLSNLMPQLSAPR